MHRFCRAFPRCRVCRRCDLVLVVALDDIAAVEALVCDTRNLVGQFPIWVISGCADKGVPEWRLLGLLLARVFCRNWSARLGSVDRHFRILGL